LSKIEGLEDFFNGVSEPSAELDMTVNQAESNRIGLTPTQVADQVSGALLGQSAGEIRLDDRSVGVRVRAPDSVRFDPHQLGAIPVFSAQTRATAPLAAPPGFLGRWRPYAQHSRRPISAWFISSASIKRR